MHYIEEAESFMGNSTSNGLKIGSKFQETSGKLSKEINQGLQCIHKGWHTLQCKANLAKSIYGNS